VAARFFVDENDLALGKALAELHGNVVFPGHPDLPDVPRRSLDDEWLAVVGAQALVVITRGKRIRYRPVERAMRIDHRVRGFVLTAPPVSRPQTAFASWSTTGQTWRSSWTRSLRVHGCTPSPRPAYARSR